MARSGEASGISDVATIVAHAADTAADLQERIDVLIAFTGGILFDFDRDGRYLRISTGEPQLLARPAEELIGRTVAEVLGEEVGARFHEAFRGVVDTGQPTAFEYSLDVQAGRCTFSCQIRPRESRDGGERTVTLLVRDITAAKALEAKLVQAERLAALGLLAATVGHEIRQPLAYVITSLDALARELAASNVPEHAHASLEKIRGGASRIGEIASSLDLLAGHRRRPSTPIDVLRPLQTALEICATELSASRVERNLPDLPLVCADEGQLSQVFANVLLNAAQSRVPQGGEPHVIKLSASRIGDRVRISVADNGVGIAPENMARIFDPLFTTREKEGGSGLGLFVTRGIVDANGGSLEVTSELGRGTHVDVLLPVARASQLPKEPTTGVRTLRRRLSILAVDDERGFLESLRLALDDAHHVETAQGGAAALRILDANPTRYDAILCDLSMPEVDGATFYERVEALGLAGRFVLMTGGAFTSRAAEFMARNVCPTIGKPFQLERLLGLLDDITRDRSAS